MINILVTSFIMICLFFSFIIYCALANKKPTPFPCQNIRLKERTIMKALAADDSRLLADTLQEIRGNDGLDVMSAKDVGARGGRHSRAGKPLLLLPS